MEFFQGLCLKMGNERQDNFIKGSGKYLIQFVDSQVDTMVGDSPLGKVIGPDPFTAVTAADLALAVFGNFIVPFLLQFVKEAGPHNLHGFGLILVL
jgi:hypothetical protein